MFNYIERIEMDSRLPTLAIISAIDSGQIRSKLVIMRKTIEGNSSIPLSKRHDQIAVIFIALRGKFHENS